MIDCDSFKPSLLFHAVDSIVNQLLEFIPVRIFINKLREILNDQNGTLIKEIINVSQSLFDEIFDKKAFVHQTKEKISSSFNDEYGIEYKSFISGPVLDVNAGSGQDSSLVIVIKRKYENLDSFEKQLEQFLEDTKPSAQSQVWNHIKSGAFKKS